MGVILIQRTSVSVMKNRSQLKLQNGCHFDSSECETLLLANWSHIYVILRVLGKGPRISKRNYSLHYL